MSRTPGSPKTGGRKVGTKNKRSERALEVFADEDFSALVEMIRMAKEAINEGARDEAIRICTTLLRYEYPQLKAIDVSAGTAQQINLIWDSGVPKWPMHKAAEQGIEPPQDDSIAAARRLLDQS